MPTLPSRRFATKQQTVPWSCGFICLLAMTLLATAHPIPAAHLSGCGPGCLSPGSRMDPPGRRSDDTELYVTAANPILILEQSTYHPLNCPDPNANSELVLGAQDSFNAVSQSVCVHRHRISALLCSSRLQPIFLLSSAAKTDLLRFTDFIGVQAISGRWQRLFLYRQRRESIAVLRPDHRTQTHRPRPKGSLIDCSALSFQ